MSFLFWKRTPDARAQKFWECVSRHRLQLVRESSETKGYKRAFDALSGSLCRYNPRLGFELLVSAEEALSITITAYGKIDSFDSVRRLVDAAPHSRNLTVTAFRQPEGEDFSLEIAGRTVSPAKTRFEPMTGKSDPSSLGLTLFFLDGESLPRVEREFAGQIMLQTILGEYVAATCIDHVEVQDASAEEMEKYIPLAKIQEYVAWHARRHPRKTH